MFNRSTPKNPVGGALNPQTRTNPMETTVHGSAPGSRTTMRTAAPHRTGDRTGAADLFGCDALETLR